MKFYIKKIILWSRNINHSPRIIEFATDKLNVLTGKSKTGKSAIIPIIDYCSGSSTCAIPVTTIRDACSWFGIIVQTPEGEKLFARREPEHQKSTEDMFIVEGKNIQIPAQITHKNSNVDQAKNILDKISGLSNLGFDFEESGNGFKARPSFRDLLAFCFQPQNIVANPDVLFFKADTMQNREKLRTIFPYVLDALSPEILAKKWEVSQLERTLKKKAKELSALQSISAKWESELYGLVAEATSLGLYDGNYSSAEPKRLHGVLKEISTRSSEDSKLTKVSHNNGAVEFAKLEIEERKLSTQLSLITMRINNIEGLNSAVGEYSQSIEKKRGRLEIARWLREFNNENSAKCPICGDDRNSHLNELNSLCDALASSEITSRMLNPSSNIFDKERISLNQELEELTEKLKGIKKRQKDIEKRSERIEQAKTIKAAIDRYLGRLEKVIEVFEQTTENSELQHEIDELKSRIFDLNKDIDEAIIAQRLRGALLAITSSMARILPNLDTERPNDAAELKIDDLTIRVTGQSGRADYLWEIGSGANWIAYHISAMLALHELFISKRNHPAPSFLVIDQPSQVYFPRKLAGSEVEESNNLADEDLIAVSKVFSLLRDSANINIKNSRTNGLQIIVLDHVGQEAWSGDSPNDVNHVDEWREKRALVPYEWLNDGTQNAKPGMEN